MGKRNASSRPVLTRFPNFKEIFVPTMASVPDISGNAGRETASLSGLFIGSEVFMMRKKEKMQRSFRKT